MFIQKNHTVSTSLMALAFLCIFTLNGWCTGPGYTIIDLGTLGGMSSGASDINNVGQVVGSAANLSENQHAFIWDVVNGMSDLGTLGSDVSVANDINDAGQVVGYSYIASWARYAFIWDTLNGMHDLGTLGGLGGENDANGINDLGFVVGRANDASKVSHAYIWNATDGMEDISGKSAGYGINNIGQVVGWSTADSAGHAFIWDAMHGMLDLGTLGGAISYAVDINDAGKVIGTAKTVSDEDHAFIWDTIHGMLDLGTLGGDKSYAHGINNLGQVVGYSTTASDEQHAFIWDAVGGMRDLGTLSGDSAALSINDAGQIVGYSKTASDEQHAVLWQSEVMTDAMVYKSSTSAYLGNDIYNLSGFWQTITSTAYAGRKATFYIRGQNDGTAADTLCFKGPAGNTMWEIAYIDSATGNDITAQVTGAGWQTATTVPVSAIRSIKIEVTPALNVTPGELLALKIKVSSVTDPTREDTVKILATMQNTPIPDAQIYETISSTYIGNDIYNSTGIGQIETRQVYPGAKTTFYIRGQNDSNYTDYIVFKGPVGSTNWNIKYIDSATGNNITTEVISTGWQTADLVPISAQRSIKIEVTPIATIIPGTKLDLAVSVYMAGDMLKRDVAYCTTQTICVYQPDGSVYQASSGSYIGSYLYNTTGSGQTETRTISRGTKTTYYFKIRNNGNVSDTFNLKAPAGDGDWQIRYVNSTTGADVTADLISDAGWTSETIPKGGSRSMKVEVTALNSLAAGVELPVLVMMKSNTNPTKTDAVKLITTTR